MSRRNGWLSSEKPITRTHEMELVRTSMESHWPHIWTGLEYVSRAGNQGAGEQESWMQSGRDQRQSGSHEGKLEPMRTNCYSRCLSWHGTPKLPCPAEGACCPCSRAASVPSAGLREPEAEEPAGAGEAVGHLMSHTYMTCPTLVPVHLAQWPQSHFFPSHLMEISLWPPLTQNNSDKCNSILTKLTWYKLLQL